MQSDPTRAGVSTLREYVAILRRRKWSILLMTALVVGSTMYFTYEQAPAYESTARVLVLPMVQANPAAPPPAINMQTEAGLVESATVANIVQQNVGSKGDPLDLLDGLSVTVESNTEILNVSYEGDTR